MAIQHRKHKRTGPANNTSNGSTWAPTVQNGYWVYNNIWNDGSTSGGPITFGTDYTAGQTVNTPTFPNDTLISWNFGTHNETNANTWGYPELVFGGQLGNTYGSPPNGGKPGAGVQIKNLTAFTVTFDYSIWATNSLDNFDVLMETQLTSDSAGLTQVTEFGFFLHTPSYVASWFGTTIGTPGFSGFPLVACDAAWVGGSAWIGSNGSYQYLAFRPPGSVDSLAATIDIRATLQWAVTNGHLTGNEYVFGCEFGTEPKTQDGNMLIRKLRYNFNGTVY